MNTRRDYLKDIVELMKAQGLPIVEVHPQTDEYDAEIRISPTMTIQVISPVEFSLDEQIGDGEDVAFKHLAEFVDLPNVIARAKEALRNGPGRGN